MFGLAVTMLCVWFGWNLSGIVRACRGTKHWGLVADEMFGTGILLLIVWLCQRFQP